jgi:hypothetical protein
MDFTSATLATRFLSKVRRHDIRGVTSTRVAVLGSTTTSQLTAFLDLFLFAHDIEAEIYEAP